MRLYVVFQCEIYQLDFKKWLPKIIYKFNASFESIITNWDSNRE